MGMMCRWVFRSPHSWLSLGGFAGICWVMLVMPSVPWKQEPVPHLMMALAVACGGAITLFGAFLDATLERYAKVCKTTRDGNEP